MFSTFFLPQDKPTIFSLPKPLSIEAIKERLGCSIMDRYDRWLKELFEVKNSQRGGPDNTPHDGKWAYYPWRNVCVHIPAENEFREVFNSRNYPLIEKVTQENLWNLQVGVAGLSVGSNIVLELVKTGVRKIKIADPDTIDPSNNNRLAGGGIFQIGENKTVALARKVYELNPYAQIEQFPKGLNEANFKAFTHKCDILIDEVDSFPMKNQLRNYVHSFEGKGTTLIMGTDLGENPVVEIERHEDPKFGGRVTEQEIQKILQNPPSKIAATRMFVAVMGMENIPPSLLQNFINIKQGKQKSWAQLGLAATAVAAKVTDLVLEIARGNTDKLQPLSRVTLREINDQAEEKQIKQVFEKEFGYTRPLEKIIFSLPEKTLNVAREEAEDGRRVLGWQIGDTWIEVKQIPANVITDQELAIIRTARESYRLWGVDIASIINDPLDKKWEDNVWETKHLIASIQSPNFQKTIALRTTHTSLSYMKKLFEQGNAPEDLEIWKLKHAKKDEGVRLWDSLLAYMNTYDQDSQSLALTSRLCTYSPETNKDKTGIYKEITAITFALMQLLITESKPPNFVLSTVTTESIAKILSIKTDRKKIKLNFNKIEHTLGLNANWKTVLDNEDTAVQALKTKFPGYWIKNHPLPFMTDAKLWRKSAIELLKAAKEKYG